ncbi:hypothetical protein GS597_17995 [Synechococcales cyanobacterium C]|uniref:Uncharacterized protein n=1 Tax=Petrachloros mirabilis ULC683 TaxID=2781853 RepID=A0A8K2A9K6_9CYAN|nr:hypothetical protein [Petrachloros mirabilis]NCJ08364.1 hypothetical protein [Petrachloros mirabilis ULC683]
MAPDTPPGSFVDKLLALRGHYQSLVATHEYQANHAREQLNHINALLVEQWVPTELTPSAEVPLKKPEPLSLQGTLPANPRSLEAQVSASESLQPQPLPTPEPTPQSTQKKRAGAKRPKPTSSQTPPSPPTQDPKIILPMRPAYVGLSKIDAVAKVMQERAGKILHVDDIIFELFGELDAADLKAERVRTKNVMIRGVNVGRWVKVKNVPSSYVVDTVLEEA